MKTTTAPKWTKDTIVIGQNGESFPGIRCGNLGICRPPKEEWSDWGDGWRLAHQPSGLGFGINTFPTRKNALKAAELIQEIISPEMLDKLAQNDPEALDWTNTINLRSRLRKVLLPLT